MKKWLIIIYIWIPFITAVFTFLVGEMAREKKMDLFSFLKYMSETSSDNLIYNGGFKQKVKYWNTLTPKNIQTLDYNNIPCAQISNISNSWSDIFQTVNLNEAHTYTLSFNVKTDSSKTLVLYREDKVNKEDYVFCRNNNEWNNYSKTIKPFSSSLGRLVLSLREKGTALFSNVVLIDNDASLKRKFNCLILGYVLIIILTILFSYFQNVNLTTVVVFLLFIIAPVFYINKGEVSNYENRRLNPFKPIFKDDKWNFTFGVDFNNWLNDHFCGRTFIMQANTLLKSFLNNKIDNSTVYAGSDRWYFRKNNLSLLANYEEDKDDNYKETLSSLERFSDYCKNHNSDLYILIAPCNEELYETYLSGIKLGSKKYAVGKTIEKLKRDTAVNLIYCRDVLEDNKQNGLVSYKTDHHWTEFGAFKAYQLILSEISLNHPEIRPLSEKDFVINERSFDWDMGFGTQFNSLNIPRKLQPYFYPEDGSYITYECRNKKQIKSDGNITLNDNGINKRVLLFGDSMTINIQKFFYATFYKTLTYMEYGNMPMKVIEQNINSFKPDLVIMIVYYSNFKGIKQWYK